MLMSYSKECEIPFHQTDQGKKSIPKLLYIKTLLKLLKILKFS